MNILECEHFLILSRKSMKLYRKMSTEGVKEFGFTPNETDVISFLLNNPTHNTATDIAKYRGMSKALVCTAVDQLCKNGYLSTTVDEKDRRILHLKLEKKADVVVKNLEAARLAFFSVLYEDISSEELQFFYQITQKIAKNVNSQNE